MTDDNRFNKGMVDNVFGPGLARLMAAGDPTTDADSDTDIGTDINNIDRDLVELLVAGVYAMARGHVIWIIGENQNLEEKRAKLELWLKLLVGDDFFTCFYQLPFEDPYVNNNCDGRAVGRKAELISGLLENRRMLVLTTLSALNIKIEPPPETADHYFFHLELHREIGRDELVDRLVKMGYRGRNIVEEPGDISWRGSIVDIFPPDGQQPVRVEIEGDTVVSLRLFDPDTQKSLKKTSGVRFAPARFFPDHEGSDAYFTDNAGMVYLPALLGDYRLVVSDQRKITEEFHKLLNNYEQIYELAAPRRSDPGPHPAGPSQLFTFSLAGERLLNITETWDDTAGPPPWVKGKKSLAGLNLEDTRRIDDQVKSGSRKLLIFCGDSGADQRLSESFSTFQLVDGRIPFSFENTETGYIFLADRDFHFADRVETTGRLKAENLAREIAMGDLVVHREHGIGKFVGFKRLSFEDRVTEFLKLEYHNREYLYVPVYELDVLNKYVSFEGHGTRLDRLGGNSWELKKRRARKSMMVFARELLELYAMRKAIKGSAYPRDPQMEDRLESEFQYVETEDQKRAIKDVLRDLEAEFPMDRLVCGDVSFGKTEVALRAALRVAANGKQVAVLCPTTILAFQHFSTFSKRLDGLPVAVGMLSRMVGAGEKKRIYEQLADGTLDIVIGTHSLLARPVDFRRLGLYIIDEEQRFGVFQKEKLKKNREDIDVLSMSATPIPRTLSLSMAGLHDVSNIQTPPLGRMAVKNYVGYYSREIVVSSVLNEIERQGQVFIVYNNIEKIYSFREQLLKWLPGVSSVVIHARMKSPEIEKYLTAFINKQYQVLISTTIIENGIDIPDVNTMLVLDADRFGLTQLYQLRGRIGRGSRQAYAYFLVKSMDMTDKARARLDAIREFADLGAGYRLAEFDLNLRGAGSLLGNKQHGHIEALGFDYYNQMLTKTIKELKGELEKEKESKINIHFSYSIDPGFIKNSGERIRIYRQILEADTFDRIRELRLEIEDRYGRLPGDMEKIFFAGMIRVLARACKLEEVDVHLDKVVMKFPDGWLRRLKPYSWPVAFGGEVRVKSLDTEGRTWGFHFTDYEGFVDRLAEILGEEIEEE